MVLLAQTFDAVGRFVSTVGLPTALVIAFVFFVWRVWKFFMPRIDGWFTSQNELNSSLKINTEKLSGP